MSMAEAVGHPHLSRRDTFVDVDGVVQPAAAPRFSDYRPRLGKPVESGTDTVTILVDLGYSNDRIDELKALGVVG